ncbi:unnamed protein product [Ilex paraguariensis]|uniref:Uncharacterized protein n=1 Tax=Ilex paraguariensis TaxID=185542 RepID=A0ABC8V1L5_9AQUA
MDNQCNPLLSWAYYCQAKVKKFSSSLSMEELRQSLLLTTLELDSTKLKAQDELKMRDDQVNQLKDMLNRAIQERDEVQDKCQRFLIEKLLLQQQLQQYQQTAPMSGISSIEDEPRRGLDSNNGFSSSDCEESIVSSPVIDPVPPPSQPPLDEVPEIPLVLDKPLPEKGKLLQAVMKAGPLLQNLLLAGPLPQWRHPPPPLDTYQIPPPPPVVIPSPPPSHLPHQDSLLNITACIDFENCGRVNRKRGLNEDSDSSTEVKYQRVVLH